MLFTPTALIIADRTQRQLLDSARLDGPATATSPSPAAPVARPAAAHRLPLFGFRVRYSR